MVRTISAETLTAGGIRETQAGNQDSEVAGIHQWQSELQPVEAVRKSILGAASDVAFSAGVAIPIGNNGNGGTRMNNQTDRQPPDGIERVRMFDLFRKPDHAGNTHALMPDGCKLTANFSQSIFVVTLPDGRTYSASRERGRTRFRLLAPDPS